MAWRFTRKSMPAEAHISVHAKAQPGRLPARPHVAC